MTSGNTGVEAIAPSMQALIPQLAVAAIGFNAKELKQRILYQKKIAAFTQQIRSSIVLQADEMERDSAGLSHCCTRPELAADIAGE